MILKTKFGASSTLQLLRLFVNAEMADAYRVVLELKYEQLGVIARDTFIRFELIPALRKFPAMEIEDWTKPEKVERAIKEDKTKT